LADLAHYRGQLLALLVGVVSGTLAFIAGLPLPWMLGSMLGTTFAALLALPIRGPDKLRPFVIPVIGVLLGSSITSDIVSQLGNWTLTLAVLPVFLTCAAAVSYTVYRRLGGYDHVTAFYAAMPGGLNEMLLLGAAAGGDERRIALAHAARVLMVILFVVVYFAYVLGVRSTAGGRSWTALSALTVYDYAILGLCAALGVRLAKLLRLPAGPVFGPLILSGLAHATSLVETSPPTVIIICAQIVIGTVIGARFIGGTFASVARDLALALPATLGMLAVAVGFAEIIAHWVGMPLSQAFLAFSPGGLTEMSLLTLTLGQDIAFVSVTHIIRITVVIAVAPFMFRLVRRKRLQ
jgi:membrane AbrB-like protein